MKYLSYKYRIYPNKEQTGHFSKTFGCCRYVYNKCLALSIQNYNTTGKFLFIKDLKPLLSIWKKEFDWLKEPNSQTLQESVFNLEKAFKNRFIHKTANFPKFKKKNLFHNSIKIPQHFKVNNKHITLPKVGNIRYVKSRKIEGKIKSITIKQEIDQWFAILLCEIPEKDIKIDKTKIVGLDFGIKNLITTSDGEVFDYPKYVNENEIKKYARKHSKKKKGSKNRIKAQKALVKKYRKYVRRKQDYQKKIVSSITKNYDVIVVENLNVKGMIKNRKLSHSIHTASWGQIKTLLGQKSKEFHQVDRFFPSSKTCSNCGFVKPKLSLNERIYNCESCDFKIDRDINAAINLKNTVATAEIYACGDTSFGELENSNSRYVSQKQESCSMEQIIKVSI